MKKVSCYINRAKVVFARIVKDQNGETESARLMFESGAEISLHGAEAQGVDKFFYQNGSPASGTIGGTPGLSPVEVSDG